VAALQGKSRRGDLGKWEKDPAQVSKAGGVSPLDRAATVNNNECHRCSRIHLPITHLSVSMQDFFYAYSQFPAIETDYLYIRLFLTVCHSFGY
jgi:hypothetical protein